MNTSYFKNLHEGQYVLLGCLCLCNFRVADKILTETESCVYTINILAGFFMVWSGGKEGSQSEGHLQGSFSSSSVVAVKQMFLSCLQVGETG